MKFNQSTKISVIGSNGGIGAAIVDELLSQGFTNITGITISGKEKWGRNIKVAKADALDLSQIIKATEGSQIIFGAFNASEYSDKSWGEEFPKFMDNFIEAGKASISKLIFLDNVYSYGSQTNLKSYNENTPIKPANIKGQIRESVANQFLDGLQKYNLHGNIIKSSDLYGPYALNTVIGGRFFKGLFEKNSAEILPLGNNPHSFTYTRDVGRISVITALNENQPLIVHTPNTEAIGYEDLVNTTHKYLKNTPKEAKLPMMMFQMLSLFMPPVKSILSMMYQWENKFIIDSMYNKNFVPTSLESGLKETVEWFKANSDKF
jgi:nucleoside-diphosphate-sugar epimerase